MSGHARVFLEDVAEDVTVGHVGPMATEYVPDGIPFLRSLNIQPFTISLDDIKFITPDFHRKLRKSALTPGDVVIVRTGKPGTCAVVPETLPVSNCSDLVIVRCGPSLRPRFLAYWVNAVASEHVETHLVGAVQQHFNVGSARRMPVLLPPLEEQDRILAVLGALDDKIELNRRMNRTLEAMARALFRSWFVDFDPVRAKAEGRAPAHMDPATAALFPARFAEDGLPEEWSRSPLATICAASKVSIDPRVHKDALFDHFSIPAFDAGAGPVRQPGAEIMSNKLVVPDGAILFSRLNPSIPRVWWARTRKDVFASVGSTEYLVAQPRRGAASAFLYSLLVSDEFRTEVMARVTGTSNSHQRVKPGAVLEIEVVVPGASLVTAFSDFTQLWFDRVQANLEQSRTLAALRDALLPKLMSGELRVRDAERALAEAV